MSMAVKARRSVDERFRVIKDDAVTSTHKWVSKAVEAAMETGADRIYYLNSRGFGVTVWPLPPLAQKV